MTGRRTKLDVVPEKVGRPLDDEEPEAEPAGTGCRAALKCLKNILLVLGRYAGAAVVHLDANLWTAPATSDKDTAAGRGVVDRVVHQGAQHAAEQHGLAPHAGRRARRG